MTIKGDMRLNEIFIKLEPEDVKNYFPDSKTLDKYSYIFNVHFLVDYLMRYSDSKDELKKIFTDMNKGKLSVKDPTGQKHKIISEKEIRLELTAFINKDIKVDKIWRKKELKEQYSKETCELHFRPDKNKIKLSAEVCEQLVNSEQLDRMDRGASGMFFSVDYLMTSFSKIAEFKKTTELGKIRTRLKEFIVEKLKDIKEYILNEEEYEEPRKELELGMISRKETNDRQNIIVKKIENYPDLLFDDIYSREIDTKKPETRKIYFLKLQDSDSKNSLTNSKTISPDFPYVVTLASIVDSIVDKYQFRIQELREELFLDEKIDSINAIKNEFAKQLKNMKKTKYAKDGDFQNEKFVSSKNTATSNKDNKYSAMLIKQILQYSKTVIDAGNDFYSVDYLIDLYKKTDFSRSKMSRAINALMLSELEESKKEIKQLSQQRENLQHAYVVDDFEIVEANIKQARLAVFVKVEEEDINKYYYDSKSFMLDEKEYFPYVVPLTSLVEYLIKSHDYKDRIAKIFKENAVELKNDVHEQLKSIIKINFIPKIRYGKLIINDDEAKLKQEKHMFHNYDGQLAKSEQQNLKNPWNFEEQYENSNFGQTENFYSVNYLIESLNSICLKTNKFYDDLRKEALYALRAIKQTVKQENPEYNRTVAEWQYDENQELINKLDDNLREQKFAQGEEYKAKIATVLEKEREEDIVAVAQKVFINLNEEAIQQHYSNSKSLNADQAFPCIMNIAGLAIYWQANKRENEIIDIIKAAPSYNENASFVKNVIDVFGPVINRAKSSRKESLNEIKKEFKNEKAMFGFWLKGKSANKVHKDIKTQIKDNYKVPDDCTKGNFYSVDFLISTMENKNLEYDKDIYNNFRKLILKDLKAVKEIIIQAGLNLNQNLVIAQNQDTTESEHDEVINSSEGENMGVSSSNEGANSRKRTHSEMNSQEKSPPNKARNTNNAPQTALSAHSIFNRSAQEKTINDIERLFDAKAMLKINSDKFYLVKEEVTDSLKIEDLETKQGSKKIAASYANNYLDGLLLTHAGKLKDCIIHKVEKLSYLEDEKVFKANMIHFIPLHLPLRIDGNTADNHYACIVLDKINNKFFYFDPAKQIPDDKIKILANKLGFQNEAIHSNSIAFQEEEKELGIITNCGPLTAEFVECAIAAINNKPKDYNLDINLSRDVGKIRQKHINQICGLIENRQPTQSNRI